MPWLPCDLLGKVLLPCIWKFSSISTPLVRHMSPCHEYSVHLCCSLFTRLVKWANTNIKYNSKLVQSDLNPKSTQYKYKAGYSTTGNLFKIFFLQLCWHPIDRVWPWVCQFLNISLGYADKWYYYCHHFVGLSRYLWYNTIFRRIAFLKNRKK